MILVSISMFSCLLDLIFQLLALSDVDFYQLHVCACVCLCVCVCMCVFQKSEDRVNPSQAILAYAWTEICYLHNVMKPLFYFFVPKYRTNFTQLLCHFK